MRHRIAFRLFLLQAMVLGGGVALFLLILPAQVLIPHITDQLWWTCVSTILGMVVLAAAVSVGVGAYAAHIFSDLQEVTRAMTAGDLGKRISVSWSGVTGELGVAINTMAEILTQRVQMERREQSQLRAIMASMQEALVVVDPSGTIILSNPSSQQLLGMAPSPEGLPLVAACRSPELVQLVQDTQEGGQSRRMELRAPPVAPRVVSAEATPWKIDNAMQGVVVVGYDLTPQSEIDDMQREFVANVSHELKTPLTAIRGYAEILQSGALADPDNAGNFVTIIVRNAEQMQLMVDDLLRLSKLEAGRIQIVMEELSLADVIAEVLMRFRMRIEEKNLKWDVDVAQTDIIRSDRRMLIHIINNLVDNAIKYSREGDQIRIRARRDNGYWVLQVSDTGIGMAHEELPRVFERFWRADRSRTRATGGTGLGLAIVKQLVTQLRGTVMVTSAEGSGSQFTVKLPVGV